VAEEEEEEEADFTINISIEKNKILNSLALFSKFADPQQNKILFTIHPPILLITLVDVPK